MFDAPAPKKKTLEPLVSKSPEPVEENKKNSSLKLDPITAENEKKSLFETE